MSPAELHLGLTRLIDDEDNLYLRNVLLILKERLKDQEEIILTLQAKLRSIRDMLEEV